MNQEGVLDAREIWKIHWILMEMRSLSVLKKNSNEYLIVTIDYKVVIRIANIAMGENSTFSTIVIFIWLYLDFYSYFDRNSRDYPWSTTRFTVVIYTRIFECQRLTIKVD